MVFVIIREGVKVLGKAFFKSLSVTLTQNYMTEDEALRILDIEHNSSQDKIFKKYQKLFNDNSPQNKGSEYLQKMIYNAYKILSKNNKE
jgi:DnaJ-domain-containing protein 1